MPSARSPSVEIVASEPVVAIQSMPTATRASGSTSKVASSSTGTKRKSAAVALPDAPMPKKSKTARNKKEPEPSRWPWIDRCRPEMCVDALRESTLPFVDRTRFKLLTSGQAIQGH
jgi:hypothetical protein